MAETVAIGVVLARRRYGDRAHHGRLDRNDETAIVGLRGGLGFASLGRRRFRTNRSCFGGFYGNGFRHDRRLGLLGEADMDEKTGRGRGDGHETRQHQLGAHAARGPRRPIYVQITAERRPTRALSDMTQWTSHSAPSTPDLRIKRTVPTLPAKGQVHSVTYAPPMVSPDTEFDISGRNVAVLRRAFLPFCA